MAPTGYVPLQPRARKWRAKNASHLEPPPRARARARLAHSFANECDPGYGGGGEFSRKRHGIPSSARVTHHHMTRENAIADMSLATADTLLLPHRAMNLWSVAIRSSRSSSLTHLIGGNYPELSTLPRVCGKRRKWLLRRGFSRSRADKWHPETLGRRGRRSVTGETRDHPLLRPRASRSPLLSLFHPPAPSLSRHSATPLLIPLHMCSRLFLPYVPSVTPPASISRLFFPIVFFVSIYHTSCVMYPRPFFIPWGFSMPLSLFHSRSPSFSLLTQSSTYSYFFLSVAPSVLPTRLVARASPSVPQQPSRHWPSWSRERQLGQSCAGWRHPRGLSRTVRERSRGRKGAFAESGGRCVSYGVGMDGRSVRSMVWCNGGTDDPQDLAERFKIPSAGLLIAILF